MIVIHRRPRSLVAVVAAVALMTSALVATASAVPGVGTFTQITTPAGSIDPLYDSNVGTSFHVSGVTSLDVTSVDFDCISETAAGAPTAQVWASSVPVSGGTFSSTATVPGSVLVPPCRLRAVPTGEPLTGYLGSYAGPRIYNATYHVGSSGSTNFSISAITAEPSAFVALGRVS
jgi:hypothetical protein